MLDTVGAGIFANLYLCEFAVAEKDAWTAGTACRLAFDFNAYAILADAEPMIAIAEFLLKDGDLKGARAILRPLPPGYAPKYEETLGSPYLKDPRLKDLRARLEAAECAVASPLCKESAR